MIDCPHTSQYLSAKGWLCDGCEDLIPSEGNQDLASVMIAPSAMPSRLNGIPPRRPNNSFEKGIRRDDRGVPFLDTKGSPLRMKETFRPSDYGRERITINTERQ
jgi:hypothetical protein